MAIPLQVEFDYYLAHEKELIAKYRGRFIVIKGQKVLGAFASEIEAVTEVSKTEPVGSFLIQLASPDSHTQTFFSRVAVAG